MTLQKHHNQWIIDRIYEKLLKSNRSRTITFENLKDTHNQVDIRDFNGLMQDLANRNYVHPKPKSNTWILVEDNPLKYANHIEVDENYVKNLEKYHGRRNPEPKGAVERPGGYEQKYG
jgi:hypothetical protein